MKFLLSSVPGTVSALVLVEADNLASAHDKLRTALTRWGGPAYPIQSAQVDLGAGKDGVGKVMVYFDLTKQNFKPVN